MRLVDVHFLKEAALLGDIFLIKFEQLDELGITKEQLTAALDPASMTDA